MADPTLFDAGFQTSRPARPVFCHQEFLDKLSERRSEPIAKRAALLMQRMAVDISRLHYKATSGVNRGWRRSRLGGSSGSHFYAWWVPAGAPPVKQDAEFAAQSDAIFLRDLRHHDDHAPVNPGSLSRDYMPLSVPDLRNAEYAPEPWTQPQLRFARGRGAARVLKGHPGSGKTTALLHAADESNAAHVLYLTFSQDLAAIARDYFDRYCSASRTFTVLTYPEFLRQVTDWRGPSIEPAEARAQFRRDLMNYQRAAGQWFSAPDALYDEMYAHLVGAALPETVSRYTKAEHSRLPANAYAMHRSRYLGTDSVNCVLETARKLERPDAPLMDRYFPDLARAWRGAHSLAAKPPRLNPAFLDYRCIAVDEIQDLTPLECYVVIALARLVNQAGGHAQLLLAGDEAQTVRPTDFEWAWLNDLLHNMVGQQQEFKLPVNLRSPRQLAELVNRTWDLYDFLDKQDRPSGVGYADIDDDTPNQTLYVAVPAAGLPELMADLSQREGLALIAFDKSTLPKESLPFVLSPAEAKGLDFHSVCIINGGAVLRRIANDPPYANPAGALERRLAIDQLRVAISRPTDRLIWVDVAPDRGTVGESSNFLRPSDAPALPPITAEALRASMAEEDLDIEERIQRCRTDALQLVSVKPDLAWSRAQQAVSLLGKPGELVCVTDETVRSQTWLTLAQVCVQLDFRRQKLSPELGHPNLLQHAASAALSAREHALMRVLRSLAAVQASQNLERLKEIAIAVQIVAESAAGLPSWFTVEFMPRADEWANALESSLESGDNPLLGQRILPPFFDALRFTDALVRKEKLAERAVRILIKSRRYADALTILEKLPGAKSKITAECYEETGQFGKAAEVYLSLGDKEKALKCYRSAPDFAAALTLVRQLEGHAAQPSLEWLAELDGLLEKRPANFNRVMTTPEKKLLESMLERGLGVQRKKPAPKPKTAVGSKSTKLPKKAAPKKAAVKKVAKLKIPRGLPPDKEYF